MAHDCNSCGAGCSDTSCCDDEEEDRMCKLTQPAGKFDLHMIKKIVKNPTHICKCCGRVADGDDLLCDPEKL